MAEFPALPLWTDALLGDTQHLSTAEFGAYMLLLIVAWRTPGCDLPDDDSYLARITRLGPNFNRHRDVLRAFWHAGAPGRLQQKRLTKEREYLTARSQAQADRAAKRWAKPVNGNPTHPVRGKNDHRESTPTEAKSLNGHETKMPAHMPERSPADAPTPTPTPIREDPPRKTPRKRRAREPFKTAGEKRDEAIRELRKREAERKEKSQ